MSDFESDLTKIPLRRAPLDWRGDILRAARAGAPERDPLPWWRRCLAPQPLTLAAAWLVIAGLQLMTPADAPVRQRANSDQLKAQIRAQRKLLAELLQPARVAPATSGKQGAAVPRWKPHPA